MSLENHLDRLKSLLSDEDLKKFESLSQRMSQLGGDFSKLTESELELIAEMEKKYGDEIHATAVENVEEVVDTAEADDVVQDNAVVPDEFPLLKTEFAGYVKDMLLRELSDRFSDLKSSVNFAYENKWIPQELQNQDVCETLYERFCSDIERANEWRYQLQGQRTDTSNKTMAIGLTWFMYVFQLKQWVDKYSG